MIFQRPPCQRGRTQLWPLRPPSSASACGRAPVGSSDEVRTPSRMMRAPLLCPLVGGADGGSCFTFLGVDAHERDADLDADPEERDAIRRGIHELPWGRDREGGGGIPRMDELPPSMCASTASRVRPCVLHQRRRPAALLRAKGGEGCHRRLVSVRTCGGRTPSTPGSCRGRSAAPRAARRSSSRAPRRWRRRGRRPLAGEGSGRPPRPGAILRVRGSPAAPSSPPCTGGGPPTGAGNAGRSHCSLRHRCRRSPPLLEVSWRVDWGEGGGECGQTRGRPR
jgi:hypothetical protein